MKIVYPDYNNSIVNIASSIEKYFDLDNKVPSLKFLDNILENEKPKNVVVILFDGMGSNLIKEKLKGKFLDKNMILTLSSTCPATTTAATTSIMTGLYPCTHGYLGWDMYYKKENAFVTMFTNTYKDTKNVFEDYVISDKYFSNKTIMERILENKKYHSKIVFPLKYPDAYTDIDDMFKKVKENLNIKGKNYIYAYYVDPDSIMHVNGTQSKETNDSFLMINDKCEEFAKTISDTLLIITADHGHKDTEYIYLEDYEDIFKLIKGNVWIEGRCCAFNVTDKKLFNKLFNKYFKDYFILKTKDEVKKECLFGLNNENEFFNDELGDFLALAYSNKIIKYKRGGHVYKSNHAGFTEEEMQIPLIIIKK